jgi:hypothetical protein
MPSCNSSWPLDPNPESTLTFADIKKASLTRRGKKPTQHMVALAQAKVRALCCS